ncbi:hypothetical protein CIPAW_03G033900 [Carya illinoinensis]|uniref:Uncharacterized protein n=1 Tax=Carya illinoinensis TaxID=32201 RepID=A0A8T1QY16_CARIL|nr:hypothetical protein CIPAW_03G033900 [Carya illinoinensis]
MVLRYCRASTWLGNRVFRRGPAPIDCEPNPALRYSIGQGDKYFPGRSFIIGSGIEARVWAWSFFGDAEAAELVGNALDGGLGEGISVGGGGGGPDEETGGSGGWGDEGFRKQRREEDDGET